MILAVDGRAALWEVVTGIGEVDKFREIWMIDGYTHLAFRPVEKGGAEGEIRLSEQSDEFAHF